MLLRITPNPYLRLRSVDLLRIVRIPQESPPTTMVQIMSATNEGIEEQAATLRVEAAVMNPINPVSFAIIVDRISFLLESGHRTEQTASSPLSSTVTTVDTEEAVYAEYRESDESYSGSDEREVQKFYPKKLRYRTRKFMSKMLCVNHLE